MTLPDLTWFYRDHWLFQEHCGGTEQKQEGRLGFSGIQARDGGGLVLSVNYGSSEIYSNSWYVLKEEPTGFFDRSDVRCARKSNQG